MKKIISLGGILATVILLGAGCNLSVENTTPVQESLDSTKNTIFEEPKDESNNQMDINKNTNPEEKPKGGLGSASGPNNNNEIEYYTIDNQNLPSISQQGWTGLNNGTYGYKFIYPNEFNCQKEPGSLDCELESCKQAPTEMDRPELVVRNRINCQNTCVIQEGTFSCSPAQIRIVTYEKKVPFDMKKFCSNFYNSYNNVCLFEKLTNVEEYEARYTFLSKDEQNGETTINDLYYIVPENSDFMYQIVNSNNIKKTNERAIIEALIKGITYKK